MTLAKGVGCREIFRKYAKIGAYIFILLYSIKNKKVELMAENGVVEECEARVRLCVTWNGT